MAGPLLGVPCPIGALALPPPKQEWRIIRKNFFWIYDLMTQFHCLRASCLAAAIGGSALVGMAPAAQAAMFTEYTIKAAFEAALAPGAYTETQMYDNYPNYSGGSGFSYTAAATGGRYKIGANDLTTAGSGPSMLTFSFGSGIKAFGDIFTLLIIWITLSLIPCKLVLIATPLQRRKCLTQPLHFMALFLIWI